ncbi:MAG: hypothetical protein K9L86_04025 [Candidatus Omnitrophica bacterium]|nr:hypothetical protein [Candidatus Omnitrophota bacterium]
MRLIKVAFLLLFLLLPILLYSAESYRNPFESLLPKEEVAGEAGVQEVVKPLTIVVQGVLWGSLMPQTIIDGEVYKVGDQLKSLENASVLRITKNVVFIVHGDKIHKMMVTKK